MLSYSLSVKLECETIVLLRCQQIATSYRLSLVLGQSKAFVLSQAKAATFDRCFEAMSSSSVNVKYFENKASLTLKLVVRLMNKERDELILPLQ